MNRLRLLVMKAHPNLAYEEKDRALVSYFLLGLRDRELASTISVTSIPDSTEAERRAVNGESTRRHAGMKKAYTHYLPSPPVEQLPVPQVNSPLDNSVSAHTEDVAAALYDRRNSTNLLYCSTLPSQSTNPFRGISSAWNNR